MKKLVKVVAAIIENEQREILCALRSPNMLIPNKWEFPGGRIEADEDLETALKREIQEELGCTIETYHLFNEHTHEYDTFIIILFCFKARIVKGEPISHEHSKLLWMKRENLLSLVWAPKDFLQLNS